MKRDSTSLVTGEMQTKNGMRYHYIPTRMAIIHKTDKTRRYEAVTKLEPSSTDGTYRHFGKLCQFPKSLNTDLPYGNVSMQKLVCECSQQQHS